MTASAPRTVGVPVWHGPHTLYSALDWCAAVDPDRLAVVTASDRRTYRQLRDGARRVAAAMRDAGVERGSTVALICDNRPEWMEVAFGAAALGARLVPLNPWSTAAELDYLLRHARAGVILAAAEVAGSPVLDTLMACLPALDEDGGTGETPDPVVVVIGGSVPDGVIGYRSWAEAGPVAGFSADDADAGQPAFVLYTSGSTARPKAVSLTHGHLLENGFHIGERQGLSGADRVFLASPLFWAYGGANALMATLTHAATLVLQSRFDPEAALSLLERERCTAIYTLPAMTRALLNHPSFAPHRVESLTRGVTIGPPAEVRAVADELGVDGVCNIYGSTEVYGNCCVTPGTAPLERRLTSQGPPLPGVRVRVVDPGSRRELPAGETGAIEVHGRVTPGYVDADGRPVPVIDADGWFRTGDLGALDDEGWLTFSFRATEMIKTAGINVSPFEVEDVLAAHPSVAEVAVVGGAHPVRGEEVVAYVRLRPHATVTPEELRAHCRARLAGYKVPAVVAALDEFPLTRTGKLDRRALKADAGAAVQRGASSARTTNWNRWGADDEVGAPNLITPAVTRGAAGLVRHGRVVVLGQPLGPDTVVPRHRKRVERFMVRDGGDYAAGARRRGGFQFAEDVVSYAAHCGTHIDALCHVWYEDQLYNGHSATTVRSTTGAQRCGAERLRPMVTRGILLDVSAVAGAPLGPGDAVTDEHLVAAADRAGVALEPGDAVLIRTGWFGSAGGDPDTYLAGEPGLELSAARWLAAADVAVVGADNFAVEAMPFPGEDWFPVHQFLLRDHGVPLIEGLVLDEFAALVDGAFLFVASPVSVVGSTAGQVCPIAVL